MMNEFFYLFVAQRPSEEIAGSLDFFPVRIRTRPSLIALVVVRGSQRPMRSSKISTIWIRPQFCFIIAISILCVELKHFCKVTFFRVSHPIDNLIQYCYILCPLPTVQDTGLGFWQQVSQLFQIYQIFLKVPIVICGIFKPLFPGRFHCFYRSVIDKEPSTRKGFL